MILDTWIFILLLGVTFGLSWLGTGFVSRIAIERKILDIPSSRSLHNTPIPRGGGIVFSTLFLLAVVAFIVAAAPNTGIWIGLLGGGILVALVGWLDDCRGLPSFFRLALYAV